jgi:hypothetical protein
MKAAHLLVPVSLLAISSPALGASTARLAYEAPPGCPSEAEFIAAVTTRGADFGAPGATEGHPLMVISIR